MSFCTNCEKSTTRSTINGVEFICTCGTRIPGTAYDVKIKSYSLNKDQINQQFVRNAPFDRTNNLIPEPCTKCGRLYKTQVRSDNSEIITKLCICEVE